LKRYFLKLYVSPMKVKVLAEKIYFVPSLFGQNATAVMRRHAACTKHTTKHHPQTSPHLGD